MREFGSTEWGRRWILACALPGDSRTSRGRSYAHQGAVVEMEVSPGEIAARVQGSRRRPYRVTISAEALPEQRLEQAAAGGGVTLAGLLKSVGDDLFPQDGETDFECSCPDWAVPCKHAVAAALAFARALDEAPERWLAFRFLGRGPLTVVGAAASRTTERQPARPAAAPMPRVPVGPSAAEFWGGALPSAPGVSAAPGLLAAPGLPPLPAAVSSPLSPIAPPPDWGPDHPDLDTVFAELTATLARITDAEDIEAAIASAYAPPAPAPRSQPKARPSPPACRRCGARIDRAWRFCPDCGAKLPSPPIAPASTAR